MAHTPLFDLLVRALRKTVAPPSGAKQHTIDRARRRFLQTSAVLGSTTGLTGLIGCAGLPNLTRADPVRVAVVGGGLAGLCAAYRLKQAGLNATVYEATARPGGRVFSRTGLLGDGLINELGAEFISSDHKDMLDLVREFDLKLFNRIEDADRLGLPRTAYYLSGERVSEATLAEHLHALAEQIAQDAQQLDRQAAVYDQLSVSAYLDQHADRIPSPAIRQLIEQAVRVEFGREPEQATALQLLYMLPSVKDQNVELLSYSDEALTVQGGNSLIIAGLLRALSDQIQLRKVLTGLTMTDQNTLQMTFSDAQTAIAEYVILAMPFTALRQVDLQVELPAELSAFIREVDLGANEKILAGFSQRAWRRADGFVNEAWSDQGFCQVWDSTQRQTDRRDGALTYYLGGAAAQQVERDEEAAQGRQFVQQLGSHLPDLASVATGKIVRTRWSHNDSTRGSYTSFKPGQLTRFGRFMWVESPDPNQHQSVHAGRLVFAGEQFSDEYYGFMNGAAQTGRLAAAQVVQLINARASAYPAETSVSSS